MEWDKDTIVKLEEAVRDGCISLRRERPTDRKNFSAIWNRKLSDLGITLVIPRKRNKGRETYAHLVLSRVLEIINMENEKVSGSMIVANPDRPGQHLLVPRDIASKILMLGMP
jgi:hypothetical protein